MCRLCAIRQHSFNANSAKEAKKRENFVSHLHSHSLRFGDYSGVRRKCSLNSRIRVKNFWHLKEPQPAACTLFTHEPKSFVLY